MVTLLLSGMILVVHIRHSYLSYRYISTPLSTPNWCKYFGWKLRDTYELSSWNILEIFANKNCENIERVHMLDIFRTQCFTKAIPWSFFSAKYVCIWLPKMTMILLYHTLLSCTGCQLEGRCMDDFYLSTVGIVFCAQPPVSNSNKTYAIHISPFRDPFKCHRIWD